MNAYVHAERDESSFMGMSLAEVLVSPGTEQGRKEKLSYRAELGQQVESWVRTLRVMGDDFYRNLSRIEFSVRGLVS